MAELEPTTNSGTTPQEPRDPVPPTDSELAAIRALVRDVATQDAAHDHRTWRSPR